METRHAAAHYNVPSHEMFYGEKGVKLGQAHLPKLPVYDMIRGFQK